MPTPEEIKKRLAELEASEVSSEKVDEMKRAADDMYRQLRETQRRIDQQNAEKRQLLAELERISPVELSVERFREGKLFIKASRKQHNVSNIIASYNGWWDSTKGMYIVSIQHWVEMRGRLEKVEGVSLSINPVTAPTIKKWEEAPDYLVRLDEEKRFFEVLVIKGREHLVARIPGSELSPKRKAVEVPIFNFPIVEGFRLAQEMKKLQNAEWEGDAFSAVEEEVKRRAALDALATVEDTEFPDVFQNGHQMRPFQRVGAAFLDQANGRALLCDQMGLGKTWQALGYSEKHKYRTIIICPAHLMSNWRREIMQLTGEEPYVAVGHRPKKWDFEAFLIKKPRFTIVNYHSAGKRIHHSEEVTDERGRKLGEEKIEEAWPWIDFINQSGFDLAIIDESHYIKNVDSHRSRGIRGLTVPRVVCLTGTPVLNRPGELWAPLSLIAPGKFPDYSNFVARYTGRDGSAKNVSELRSTLRPLMIRRTKADVLKELPPLNRMWQWHELGEEARAKYQEVLVRGLYRELESFGSEASNVTSILAQIMRLKQICAQDKVEQTADLAVELYDSGEFSENRGKVIIFTQFVPVANAIKTRLNPESVLMTGQIARAERDGIEEKFQNDPNVHFLVATWQVAGEGLNLTAADFVIFNDLFWTPGAHKQCEERAYGRLSNIHPIDSYYICTEKTLETWIKDLLGLKQGVIDAVVEGVQDERASESIAMELIRKLKEEMKRT